jgi:hypothetical protein
MELTRLMCAAPHSMVTNVGMPERTMAFEITPPEMALWTLAPQVLSAIPLLASLEK